MLYLPFLAQIVSDRPLMKGIHLVTAVVWLTALALVALLGDREALRRTRRDIERFDADDVLFVRTRGRSRVAGRFNGGQKAHAIAQAGLTVLFTVSGVLLWLGERDTAFRLPGTIALHDAATLLLAVLVAGHIMQATSHPESLEGIRRGTVRASYAAAHHARWDAPPAGGAPGGGACRGRVGSRWRAASWPPRIAARRAARVNGRACRGAAGDSAARSVCSTTSATSSHLAHDEVALVALDDGLGLGKLMSGDDEEQARVAADVLVGGDLEPHGQLAVAVAALADEAGVVGLALGRGARSPRGSR